MLNLNKFRFSFFKNFKHFLVTSCLGEKSEQFESALDLQAHPTDNADNILSGSFP
jgi:hypothetical protein